MALYGKLYPFRRCLFHFRTDRGRERRKKKQDEAIVIINILEIKF